jgi:hypothetical protein
VAEALLHTALTTQVFDQFLKRRSNEVILGFFIGLAMFTLITLATVDPPFNPVFGASLVFLLTVVALVMLVFLFYSTINQMRPSVIVDAIHDQTLASRDGQLGLVRRTRRIPETLLPISSDVHARSDGFVTHINLETLIPLIEEYGEEIEIVLLVSIGSYIAFHDRVAEIKVREADDVWMARIEDAVRHSIYIERMRDIESDPAFGIEQLVTIAWTSVSPAKGNLVPGLVTVFAMRDILARWLFQEREGPLEGEVQVLPIVYPDNVQHQLLAGFESLAVVSASSMQHQIYAEVMRTFANLFEAMIPANQLRVADIIRRLMMALGDHILTSQLEEALLSIVSTLERSGYPESAAEVNQALATFRQSIGEIRSANTRISLEE